MFLGVRKTNTARKFRAVNIIPSPTACAGNLNQKAGSLSYFQTVGARNTRSTDLSTALDGKAL